MRFRFLVAALFAALTLSLTSVAHGGRQSIVEGLRSLRGLSFESVAFQVPGDWMRNPRLRGRLDVRSGGRKDIDVYVLREADVAAWEKGREVAALHEVRRATTVTLDVPLPGPGRYVVVLSNRFSKIASKQIAGDLALTWEDDPSLPSGEELRRRVRFLDVSPDLQRLEIPSKDADSLAAVLLERAPGDSVVIQVRRHMTTPRMQHIGSWAGEIESIGTFDLHADGDRDVLLVGSAPDSSGLRRDLVLVCPRQLACLALSLIWSRGPAPSQPQVRYGESYSQARFAAEQSFLERLAPAFSGAPPMDSKTNR